MKAGRRGAWPEFDGRIGFPPIGEGRRLDSSARQSRNGQRHVRGAQHGTARRLFPRLDSAGGAPGELVRVPLRLTTSVVTEGLQVAVRFDRTLFTLVDLTALEEVERIELMKGGTVLDDDRGTRSLSFIDQRVSMIRTSSGSAISTDSFLRRSSVRGRICTCSTSRGTSRPTPERAT